MLHMMIRKPIAKLACVALFGLLAACASKPEPDRLVLLGDAQAAGDMAEQVTQARALLADPSVSGDLRADLGDILAEAGQTEAALVAYRQVLTEASAANPPDYAYQIDLRARMADIALAAGDKPRAAEELSAAIRQVRIHLGADHPRLAPLLAFAIENDLDTARIAELTGLTVDSALADSVERGRERAFAAASSRSRALGPEPDFDLVRVFFGTNRAPTIMRVAMVGGKPVFDPYKYYGGKRAPLTTGSVMVSVPRNRAVGDIPKPSIFSFDRRPDPAKHVILGDMQVDATMAEFLANVRISLARSQRREIFIFIHGYNNDFPTAVERTAQLAVDLEIDGAPVLYSWPSAGSVFGYKADRAQITQATIDDLEHFLHVLTEQTGATRVNIVAHSMGNEFLVRALQEMADDERAVPAPFDQVVFASPDVDAEDFIEMMDRVHGLAKDMTLYASAKDRALQASMRFNKSGRRAGDSVEPVLLPGLNTVDTTQGTGGGLALGHSDIFGAAFPDFQAITWLSLEPEQRCILGKREGKTGTAWIFGTPQANDCNAEDFATAVTAVRRLGPDKALTELQSRALSGVGDPARWQAALKIVESLQ
ncbi:MAG: alpha/beta hydrolase [Hyphomonas sp.]|uniref:alpha/beta hydrolase n=1 Tax=Hyphomonas sp. TaxID=87 RepID=UPI0030027C37